MRCTVKWGDQILEGRLLGIKDGFFTVLVDGFSAADQFSLSVLIEAWEGPP